MRERTLRYCGALGGLLAPLLLQACEDSTKACESVTMPDGSSRLDCYELGDFGRSTLAITSPEPAGANCPDGGERIDTGFDDNDNGILDPGYHQLVVVFALASPPRPAEARSSRPGRQ
jgi:hypothetical protein